MIAYSAIYDLIVPISISSQPTGNNFGGYSLKIYNRYESWYSGIA